jgi:hypothetical protein
MVNLYFEISLSGDAPDAVTLAKFLRETIEYWAQGKPESPKFYCEDVRVIPNWRLERREES